MKISIKREQNNARIGSAEREKVRTKFKKTMRFLSMAALALMGAMMIGCSSSDDSIADIPQQPENKSKIVTLTTTVGLDAGATTRALTGEGVKTFAEGETMAVVYNNGSTTVKAVSHPLDADDIAEGAKSATFTFELEDPNTSEDVTYIYPAAMAKADGSVNYDALATQDGTLATLSSSLDLATKTEAWAGTSLPGATLENQLAILACTLKNKDGSSNITSSITGMTVSDGTNSYAVTGHDSDGHIYVAIRPTAAAALEVTATDGYFNYTKTATSRDYTQGNGYSLSWRMEKQRTDLSMVDCAGKIQATMTTANCYMVHTAGAYKLPLVYGNAIKNGEVNTVAYQPGGTTTDTYCANFTNHEGNTINAPWITKSAEGTGVDKGMGITIDHVRLFWQDAKGLITELGIDGDYLTLTVGKDATEQEGNALVAVMDAENHAIWSWHIWVTKQTFAAADLTTVATGDHNYIVTPVNLGWVGEPVSPGYCTYYQWGRKDPFIPNKNMSSKDDHTVYNISNSSVEGINYFASTTATIAHNITSPRRHFYNSDNGGPCNTTYYNMWDAQQTGADNISTATVKTVYDPCPPGFCVPTSNLLYYIADGNIRIDSNWDSTNNGKPWSTVTSGNALYFPASGNRSASKCSLAYVGTHGKYWSASPHSGMSSCNIEIQSSGWMIACPYRAFGYPVRAVAEE